MGGELAERILFRHGRRRHLTATTYFNSSFRRSIDYARMVPPFANAGVRANPMARSFATTFVSIRPQMMGAHFARMVTAISGGE